MRRALVWLSLAVALGAIGAAVPTRAAQGPQAGTPPLRIVFVDVEGGAATLIVTPAGESILVDTGWPGFEGRDPRRIRRAAEQAGAAAIDHLVTTHWHVDHYGGLGRLSELMPVRRFYDRGIPDTLPEDPRNFPTLIAAYKKASDGKRTTLRPADTIPLRSGPGAAKLTLTCLTASEEVVGGPGTANPECAKHQPQPPDPSDNAKSISLLLGLGDFRFLDCGDLTWNIEHKLVCPTNRIGKVDLFQVTHHGSDSSNNPALVHAIRPRVAVIDNGPRKGGGKQTYATLKASPGLETIFQLHRNLETTDADNAPPEQIANLRAECEGLPVTAEVTPVGKRYTVSVGGKATRRTFETR